MTTTLICNVLVVSLLVTFCSTTYNRNARGLHHHKHHAIRHHKRDVDVHSSLSVFHPFIKDIALSHEMKSLTHDVAQQCKSRSKREHDGRERRHKHHRKISRKRQKTFRQAPYPGAIANVVKKEVNATGLSSDLPPEYTPRPINISAEVSLLTKPSSYWTNQVKLNSSDSDFQNVTISVNTVSNSSTTRSIGTSSTPASSVDSSKLIIKQDDAVSLIPKRENYSEQVPLVTKTSKFWIESDGNGIKNEDLSNFVANTASPQLSSTSRLTKSPLERNTSEPQLIPDQQTSSNILSKTSANQSTTKGTATNTTNTISKLPNIEMHNASTSLQNDTRTSPTTSTKVAPATKQLNSPEINKTPSNMYPENGVTRVKNETSLTLEHNAQSDSHLISPNNSNAENHIKDQQVAEAKSQNDNSQMNEDKHLQVDPQISSTSSAEKDIQKNKKDVMMLNETGPIRISSDVSLVTQPPSYWLSPKRAFNLTEAEPNLLTVINTNPIARLNVMKDRKKRSHVVMLHTPQHTNMSREALLRAHRYVHQLGSHSDRFEALNNMSFDDPMFEKALNAYIDDLSQSIKRSNSNGKTANTTPNYEQQLQDMINDDPLARSRANDNNSEIDILDMNRLLKTIDIPLRMNDPAMEDYSKYPSLRYFSQPWNRVTKMIPVFDTPSINSSVKASTAPIKPKPAKPGKRMGSIMQILKTRGANIDADSIKNLNETELLELWELVKTHRNNDSLPCLNFTETLERILETIEDIKDGGGSSQRGPEGMPCNVNGSWLSTVAGMRIDLILLNGNSYNVTIASKVPKTKDGGLLYSENCTDWSMHAKSPLTMKSNLIQLSAVNEHDKRLAVFLGECRTCHERNLIVGHWLVMKAARDCEDLCSSQEVFADVWRKESLHTLRKSRLEKLKAGLLLNSTSSAQKANATTPHATTINITIVTTPIVVTPTPTIVETIYQSASETTIRTSMVDSEITTFTPYITTIFPT